MFGKNRGMVARVFTAGAVIALSAVSISACSPAGGSPSSGVDDDQFTIGLAVPTQQIPFYVSIRQAAEAEAKAQGAELVVADAKGNPDAQVSQVQDFITQGVDAIIYMPAGSSAASVPVRAAKSAGIPVVTVDDNPKEAPGDAFIATDSVAASKALGKWVVEQTNGKANLAIVEGILGTTPDLARDKGFTAALDGTSVTEVARQSTKQWLQDESYAITTDMLQANPAIDVVFGHSDGLAMGASQAARNAGFEDVLVVGFDGQPSALEAIVKGELGATITQQTNLMGKMSVETAMDLLGGKEVPKETLLEGFLTTKDNAQKFLDVHP